MKRVRRAVQEAHSQKDLEPQSLDNSIYTHILILRHYTSLQHSFK